MPLSPCKDDAPTGNGVAHVFMSKMALFEISKTTSYQEMFNTENEWTANDITNVNENEINSIGDVDIICGGFPCQAFSLAGKRQGFQDTRGTLFFDIMRFASVLKPKCLLLENVKGLVSHDKGHTLDVIISTLCANGYTLDFNLLNSKYFGVPQNRERIYIVAIRDDLITPAEWEISGNSVLAKGKRRIQQLNGIKTFNFDWPDQQEVTVKLRDILEPEVDDKYYLSEEKTAKLIQQLNEQGEPVIESDLKLVGRIQLGEGSHDLLKRVYSTEGVSNTLSTMGGGNTEPKIAEPHVLRSERTEYGKKIRSEYEAGSIAQSRHNMTILQPRPDNITNTLTSVQKDNLLLEPHIIQQSQSGTRLREDSGTLRTNSDQQHLIEQFRPVLTPDRETKRQNGRRFKEDDEPAFTVTAQDRHGVAIKDTRINVIGHTGTGNERGRIFSPNGISPTITATEYKQPAAVFGSHTSYRIRKLTPNECWRLQGYSDDLFNKAQQVNSNSQLYKQAGNSVTVNVIKELSRRITLMLTQI